jgi:hypothetical protein
MLARFAREAEALRRLAHPRVVKFLDHGEDRDAAFIVTELVDGRDLAARLAERRLALAEIVDLFGQVCDGVAAAHAAGIVHRDLKPANILVGKDGAKVADFGLAQLGVDVAIPTLTRTNVAMGTFHYLAPEQRKDAHAVDHRADVWALGVILYEMLTGELPLGSFAPPSTTGPPGCDRRVDAIVRRALAPDPAARYASVAELARDVRALVAPRTTRRLAIATAATLAIAGGSTAVAFAVTSSPADVAVRSLDAASIDLAAVAATVPDAAVAVTVPDALITAPLDAAMIAATPPDDGRIVKAPTAPKAASKPPFVRDVKRPTGNPRVKGDEGGKAKPGGGSGK